MSFFRWYPALLALLAGFPTLGSAQEPGTRASLLVSPEWLASRLHDPDLVVLQVERDFASYAAGHVPGARPIRFADIVVERDGLPNELPDVAQLVARLEEAGVSTTSRVVVVGEPLLAARLFVTLDYLGASGPVALLDGGLARWRAERRPLSTEAAAVVPGRFEPSPDSALVVDAAWISGRLGDPRMVLLDARPETEFRGDTAGRGVVRAGHIPGAQSLYWQRTLTTPEPGVLRGEDQLMDLLRLREAPPGAEVVVYCRSGVQASYLYFVARTLGLRPRLYDTSYLDWSRRPDLPVVRP
jgi:thiosulfate/3-mercaptopyruvate sulfurtransferase